jgi:hypothetical protein
VKKWFEVKHGEVELINCRRGSDRENQRERGERRRQGCVSLARTLKKWHGEEVEGPRPNLLVPWLLVLSMIERPGFEI